MRELRQDSGLDTGLGVWRRFGEENEEIEAMEAEAEASWGLGAFEFEVESG